MTKAALVGLVRGAAIDLAPRAITVNNVQPGPIATDMTSALGEFVKPLIPSVAPWPLPFDVLVPIMRRIRRDGKGWLR